MKCKGKCRGERDPLLFYDHNGKKDLQICFECRLDRSIERSAAGFGPETGWTQTGKDQVRNAQLIKVEHWGLTCTGYGKVVDEAFKQHVIDHVNQHKSLASPKMDLFGPESDALVSKSMKKEIRKSDEHNESFGGNMVDDKVPASSRLRPIPQGRQTGKTKNIVSNRIDGNKANGNKDNKKNNSETMKRNSNGQPNQGDVHGAPKTWKAPPEASSSATNQNSRIAREEDNIRSADDALDNISHKIGEDIHGDHAAFGKHDNSGDANEISVMSEAPIIHTIVHHPESKRVKRRRHTLVEDDSGSDSGVPEDLSEFTCTDEGDLEVITYKQPLHPITDVRHRNQHQNTNGRGRVGPLTMLDTPEPTKLHPPASFRPPSKAASHAEEAETQTQQVSGTRKASDRSTTPIDPLVTLLGNTAHTLARAQLRLSIERFQELKDDICFGRIALGDWPAMVNFINTEINAIEAEIAAKAARQRLATLKRPGSAMGE